MFGTMPRGANAYSAVGMETGVVAATPHKLIVMLFEGAMLAVSSALQHMQSGNIEERGKAIKHAVAIINEGLRASLNKNAGGDIALSLDSLYEYMSTRLMTAHLKNQPKVLEEVLQLLKGLKDAWDAIDPGKLAASSQPEPAPAPAPYDPLAPHNNRFVKA